jgi:hypothetical protein
MILVQLDSVANCSTRKETIRRKEREREISFVPSCITSVDISKVLTKDMEKMLEKVP